MSFLTKMMRNVARFRHLNQINVTSCAHSRYLQKSSRDFSSNPALYIKMYMEHENKYAYNIMRNKGFAVDIEAIRECSPLDKNNFLELIELDWSTKSPAQIFEVFPKFGSYCKENKMCISNALFDNYIDNLTDSMNKATDEELVSLFYSFNQWPETPSIRTRNFIEVWVALDDACHSRLNNWSPEQMLSFISLFYMLNVTKVSDSSRKMIEKLANKAKKLTPEQLVCTLFFVGVQRRPPYDMHNLEVHLEKNFSQFSVDDLAIMSMGFFKSKTPIRSNHLVMNIMEVVIDNSKTIHEVSLAALLKVIRYSMRVPFEEALSMIYKMLDAIQEEIPRLSPMCNVHIALLGTTKLILHKGCLKTIAETVIDKLPETRLKDLERLTLSYGTFRYTPETDKNLFNEILKELRRPERDDEIKGHGRSFASCVQYFGLMGIYPVDLINRVLHPNFLMETYGKQSFNYGREVLCLNNIARIFCGDEKINFLSDKEAKILSNKYTDFVPNEDFKKQYNITEKMFIDVVTVLRKIRGGSEFVIGDHILSHHQRGGNLFMF